MPREITSLDLAPAARRVPHGENRTAVMPSAAQCIARSAVPAHRYAVRDLLQAAGSGQEATVGGRHKEDGAVGEPGGEERPVEVVVEREHLHPHAPPQPRRQCSQRRQRRLPSKRALLQRELYERNASRV